MVRCQYCTGLSISGLVRLAQEEFYGHEFPRQAFYQHHPSFNDLEQAAEHGCDLCQLILECFKGSPTDQDPPYVWTEEWLGSRCSIEVSMYAAAKELPDSNVRISINSDNLYGSDNIEKVTVFDTLLVQLGPRAPPYDSDDPDADDWEFPALSLRLDTPRDQALQIEQFRIGRYQLDPDLGSSTNYSIARQWLRSCKDEHAGCQSQRRARLPTRVIDVGADPEFRDTRILHSHGIEGDYVALSHCWGGPILPLLTNETLEPFQDSLPYAILPANFKDAIIITRELGIRYIWIDSLCIIQNSSNDWEHESKSMGNVYRNAVLTISAMASSGSSHGILRSLPVDLSPLPTTMPLSSDCDSGKVTVRRFEHKEEYLETLDRRGSLSQRAWTLQELLLSPRHLFYGAHQIYWKCPAGYQGADGLDTGLRFPHPVHRNISAIVSSDIRSLDSSPYSSDTADILQDYYGLVQDYSHRKLTFDSDKLPAFSGIARHLHPSLDGHYLAGLWSRDISRGLLWRSEMATVKHVSKYRAPSWSWAVTNDKVGFPYSGERGPLDVQLLSHEIVPKNPANPYGEVLFGSLALKGPTKALIRSTQIIYSRPCKYSIGTVYFDEENSNEEGALDIFKVSEGDEKKLVAMTNRHGDSQDWEVDVESYIPESYLVLCFQASMYDDSLVLQRVESNMYKRVGYISAAGPWSDRSEWEIQTIVLI